MILIEKDGLGFIGVPPKLCSVSVHFFLFEERFLKERSRDFC